MAKRDLNSLGDIYGGMLNTLKYNLVKESKIKKGGNDLNDDMPLDGKGPYVDGFHVALDDCGCSDHTEEDEEIEDENLEDEEIEDEENEDDNEDSEEIKKESRKIGKQILNTVMTKKTLSFDKLYARVINENYGMNRIEDAEDDSIDALGLEDEPMDDEFDGEEGGDVTIVIPKSLAQQFHNIFAKVLGDNLEGEDDMDGEDDLNFDGEDDGEDDGKYGEYGEEDEEGEASELPSTAGHSLTGRKNTVGGIKAKKSSASAKVTDEVGTKENFGTNVNMGTGSGNKVGKAYKPGSGYFQ